MGCIANFVFGFIQLCLVGGMIFATIYDQFRPKLKDAKDVKEYTAESYCITLWGARDKCYGTHVNMQLSELFHACDERARIFRVASAMALVAIALLFASFVFTVLNNCFCCCFKPLCVFLNVLAGFAALVVLILMVFSYYHASTAAADVISPNPCGELRYFSGLQNIYPKGMQFGASFIVLCVCMSAAFLNAIIIHIPI